MAIVPHLVWMPVLAGAVVLAADAANSTGWVTVVAVGGMIATLISALTGLVVALRRKDAPVVIVTPEQAKLLGLDDDEQKPPKRRIRRKQS